MFTSHVSIQSTIVEENLPTLRLVFQSKRYKKKKEIHTLESSRHESSRVNYFRYSERNKKMLHKQGGGEGNDRQGKTILLKKANVYVAIQCAEHRKVGYKLFECLKIDFFIHEKKTRSEIIFKK